MSWVTLPVLMYHDLGPPRPGMFPDEVIAPEEFEKQIAWLAGHGYVGIRPSEWIAWHRQGISLPQKPVLLTFDDGYAGVGRHGLPVLERYGFGAVIFVVTRRIGSRNTWDERNGYRGAQLMSADEILRWCARGFEFGCHTRTHPDLTSLPGREVEREIVGSYRDLGALLGRAPATFAYPWGLFNDAVHACVRDVFELGFSIRRGVNFPGTDPHLMRRAAIRSDRSLFDFASRVVFGCNPTSRLEPIMRTAVSGLQRHKYQNRYARRTRDSL